MRFEDGISRIKVLSTQRNNVFERFVYAFFLCVLCGLK